MTDAKQDDVQQDGVELGQAQQPEVDHNNVADSSTASGENHEQETNGVQKRINELTAKRYAAERERDQLKADAEKLRKELEAKQNKPDLVEAPTLPEDLYDSEAMAEYHKNMIEYNKQLAENSTKSFYESQQTAAKQQEQQAQLNKTVENYTQNALKHGVSEDKFREANNSLNQHGISAELGNYIMTDPNGGQIAVYLHENPGKMQEVLSMGVAQAAVKIANEIKPAAISTTPKVSGAPDPLPTYGNSGIEPKDDFESKYPDTQFI